MLLNVLEDDSEEKKAKEREIFTCNIQEKMLN